MPVRCAGCFKMFPEKKMVGELCKRCLKGKSSHQRKVDKFQKKINKVMGQSYGKSEVNVNQNMTPAEPTAPSPSPESQGVSGQLSLNQCLYQPSPNEDIELGKTYWNFGVFFLVGGVILALLTAILSLSGEDFGHWFAYYLLGGLGGAAIFIPLALYKFGILTWQKILALIVQLIVAALVIWFNFGD